jgi:hypothetical protein
MKYLKLLALTSVFIFSSCDKNDLPAPVNEEEVITTVRVTLTGGGQTISLTSRDLDGDGPNAPVFTTVGTIAANTTYTGTVVFLNELVNPIENITEEVVEEGVDHQVFYQANSLLGTFTYSDTDANGRPIGVNFNYTSANASNGNLTVTLIHLPNKTASGVSAGNIANAAGSTDAEVVFPIVVN